MDVCYDMLLFFWRLYKGAPEVRFDSENVPAVLLFLFQSLRTWHCKRVARGAPAAARQLRAAT